MIQQHPLEAGIILLVLPDLRLLDCIVLLGQPRVALDFQRLELCLNSPNFLSHEL